MLKRSNFQKLRNYIAAGFVAVLLMAQPMAASARVMYDTHSRDSQHNILWTQPAYAPVEVIGRGLKEPDPKKPEVLKDSPLSNPKDLFIDSHDHIYVADTGNNRIVEFDDQGKWLRYIKVTESPLNKPEGVYVTPQGDIYVADTGNKRVVRLTPDGKLVQKYERPKSSFIPSTFKYDPIRLVVDKRGYLYIATLGGYQGLLQLDPDGNFQSFYGANATELSALDKLKRSLYTKQMYANEISKLPGSISSVAVDKDGFIYTTTAGNVTNQQIKKLNIRGQNMLDYDTREGGKVKRTFGEVTPWERKYVSGQGYLQPQLVDLTIDKSGNITAIDGAYQEISQYDANGNLLYFWGGWSSDSTTQLGLIKNPIAIDSNSRGDLLILDNQEGSIQWFRQTQFGALVNQANQLTLQGRYEESEQPWKEVLRYNAYFTPAQLGLAKAAYKRGDYELAETYFHEGGSRKGYSDSYWQIRLQWFQTKFSTLATVVLIVVVGWLLFNRLFRKSKLRAAWKNRKRSTIPIIVQLRHAFTILKHPIDGFGALRYEGKGSYLSAFILLALTFASIVFSRLETSFTFNPVNPERFNALILFGEFVILWLGWVVCNYMVSSIFQGEGRFKDVFIASSYSLTPFILIGVPLAIISNIMTQSEQAIYNYLYDALIIWVGLLFIWKIQALQNYTVGETAVNVAFTAFAFTIGVILIMITFGLSSDLKSFIYEIYQEVRLR